MFVKSQHYSNTLFNVMESSAYTTLDIKDDHARHSGPTECLAVSLTSSGC